MSLSFGNFISLNIMISPTNDKWILKSWSYENRYKVIITSKYNFCYVTLEDHPIVYHIIKQCDFNHIVLLTTYTYNNWWGVVLTKTPHHRPIYPTTPLYFFFLDQIFYQLHFKIKYIPSPCTCVYIYNSQNHLHQ